MRQFIHKWRKKKVCIECGKEYMGGSTSKRCYDCGIKRTKELQERYRNKFSDKNFEKGCCFCGEKEKLQVHHIDTNIANNSSKNLMVLCRSCHHKLHGKIYNKIFSPKIRELLKVEINNATKK